jgi:hypothetical protein
MTNGFECIMKVCVSKHREEIISIEIRNMLDGIWSITKVCVYLYGCMFLRAYVFG